MGASQPTPCADGSVSAAGSARCISGSARQESDVVAVAAWSSAAAIILIHSGIFMIRVTKEDKGLRITELLKWLLLSLTGPGVWFLWSRRQRTHPTRQQLLSDYDDPKRCGEEEPAL
jgi:hypothetical protein